MSAKAIYESDGKTLLSKYLDTSTSYVQNRFITINKESNWDELIEKNPWLKQEKLAVKPDQLIKRRGKLGLIKVNVGIDEARKWLEEKMGKTIEVGSSSGPLKRFIIEPFVAHQQNEEYYVCIHAQRNCDTILFHHEGGVDIGDVESKALKLDVALDEKVTAIWIEKTLMVDVPEEKKKLLAEFVHALFLLYTDLYFTYMEINPLVMVGNKVYALDLAAKLDQTADFICKTKWGEIDFPPPFGRDAFPEEKYIAELDAKSGASLKLTILNRKGRIWTMVAGGGASVIYSDTICDLGGAMELANYGEYSGAPSESQTFEYAKTLLKLMTEGEPHVEGKILIIGGGIANFTNVSATFKGIVRALNNFQKALLEHKVEIFVRRGGPNYQEGLRIMRELGTQLGLNMHVFGTETHMTAVVGMALGKRDIPHMVGAYDSNDAANMFFNAQDKGSSQIVKKEKTLSLSNVSRPVLSRSETEEAKCHLFHKNTRAIIWGMQQRAVQGMLDFDYVCERKYPSVAAMVYPFSGNHKQKFYYGHKEIMIPVYKDMGEAMNKHPEADVLINFASLRSAYDATLEALTFPQIRTIAIIAEGIPEAKTRILNKKATEKGVVIIGPATVGGIKPGCFKIGNTGGMLDNILASKLYRPGSVAYVSRSGGMSNELNNIIARSTDGVYEGIAIGGDRYPGTTFITHMFRYQDNPDVKMIVLLGEVGGRDEYEICEALKSGRINKPVVAWCIGTCANMFTSEVQFGHAGASAHNDQETAVAKNKALKEAGAHVPESFDSLFDIIRSVYEDLVKKGTIVPAPEKKPPTVPMDYQWAQELGLIRKPSSFMSSICDERGAELLYAGMPITEIFKDELGVGGVLGLLWFQRRLPSYACSFIEMCLMITADHGPAVSGAHNTIVTARAGKDLVSSLVSGLLTIGDRFGGALDNAANQFSNAFDNNKTPMDFVNDMRKCGQLIMGIGHRVKSLNNPDVRVTIIKDFVKKHFPCTALLDYALEVEKITTSKKPNLILNVDGCIAVSFVDLLRSCGAFTREEANEYIQIGSLNGLFVLGRSMGFIGHYLDQKRLKQGLYRHPWDDITYIMPDHLFPASFE
ncbi:ATP-citrate synthase-like [Actinia tenebrosa]|uniref:ATP-citrate synthase n=1 Tax=Actinia tenebrosa TaxID=6105 RepID=A0A6P8IMK3_ACTTE|nr:ATP-citrate synthase-like [Actinia tenebrosa]